MRRKKGSKEQAGLDFPPEGSWEIQSSGQRGFSTAVIPPGWASTQQPARICGPAALPAFLPGSTEWAERIKWLLTRGLSTPGPGPWKRRLQNQFKLSPKHAPGCSATLAHAQSLCLKERWGVNLSWTPRGGDWWRVHHWHLTESRPIRDTCGERCAGNSAPSGHWSEGIGEGSKVWAPKTACPLSALERDCLTLSPLDSKSLPTQKTAHALHRVERSDHLGHWEMSFVFHCLLWTF